MHARMLKTDYQLDLADKISKVVETEEKLETMGKCSQNMLFRLHQAVQLFLEGENKTSLHL